MNICSASMELQFNLKLQSFNKVEKMLTEFPEVRQMWTQVYTKFYSDLLIIFMPDRTQNRTYRK